MKAFPKVFGLIGNYAPIMAEMDAEELCVIEGELPEGLNGTLYRNGFNLMYPPLAEEHNWLLGEGMVHAIRVENGKVSYRNRYVQTEQYKAQRKAGRRLLLTTVHEPPAEGGENVPRNFGSINAIFHSGRLFVPDEWSR
ncbi:MULTISPECIES: carotenoid oxygenase family protein [Paenibacillus]|uniref:carotenoid oxygenase family protein n=1 Tax=Paenibacillus TaxID=44249 RepID=UPI0006D03E68|nr:MULTISPECIES: carotenoid oxygenase family protein [Paenibacillus]GCL73152.1 hypothetical protein PN4B1_30880 [Paenibacillus naphthalenovorans]